MTNTTCGRLVVGRAFHSYTAYAQDLKSLKSRQGSRFCQDDEVEKRIYPESFGRSGWRSPVGGRKGSVGNSSVGWGVGGGLVPFVPIGGTRAAEG